MTKTSYDESQHRHMGYYEQGCDLDASAFKVADQPLWHVFFPFTKYDIAIPAALKKAPQDAMLGTMIFTVPNPEVAQERFASWVEKKLLPLMVQGKPAGH